ncbi:MAG: dihydrolipoyllysine-residue acetyltransferase [Gallionellales bacterium RIFCSPLOWO2_02_60_31]|nr:MAG: dihydrolipoyllysine-residue acetyltransferase [Gallionellales bacterium RIFCSPLOWO2_02_60_31]
MAETKQISVPDIGNFKDVNVVEVLVKAGDTIKVEDSLITLETDKATMDVPSPSAGVVREMKVKAGDKVSQGSVILLLESGDAAGASQENKPAAQPAPAPVSAAPVAASPAPAAQPAAAATAPAATPVAAEPAAAPVAATSAQPVTSAGKAHASPAIRRFARELGVDLAQVKGSGEKGRVTRDDVQNFVKAALAQREGGGEASGYPPAYSLPVLPMPQIDFAQFGAVETRPLARIRKLSGANLHRNWVSIPHVTQFEEADITEMEAFRKQLNEEYAKQGIKITPLAFLLRAVVEALQQFPDFNASLDASGENLILKKYFHIGVAVDTPDGLVVPVLRDVGCKGIVQLARELAEISARARDRKLTATEMQGGCFTISSLGGIGGTAFTPIINAPEVAILGVSRSGMRPVYQNGAFMPRLMLPLSLSYDHRVIDGASAARFTVYLAQTLADIRRLAL